MASPKGKLSQGATGASRCAGVELGALARTGTASNGDTEGDPVGGTSDRSPEVVVDAHAFVRPPRAPKLLVLHDEGLVVGQRGRLGEAEVVDVRARRSPSSSASAPRGQRRGAPELVALGRRDGVGGQEGREWPAAGTGVRWRRRVREQRLGTGRARPGDHRGEETGGVAPDERDLAGPAAVRSKPAAAAVDERPRCRRRRGRRRSSAPRWDAAPGRRRPTWTPRAARSDATRATELPGALVGVALHVGIDGGHCDRRRRSRSGSTCRPRCGRRRERWPWPHWAGRS